MLALTLSLVLTSCSWPLTGRDAEEALARDPSLNLIPPATEELPEYTGSYTESSVIVATRRYRTTTSFEAVKGFFRPELNASGWKVRVDTGDHLMLRRKNKHGQLQFEVNTIQGHEGEFDKVLTYF